MATVEEGLKSLLVANAAVNAVVSGRVYPMVQPQGASLPAVVYREVSKARAGQFATASSLAHPRFQFECIALTYAAAKALAGLVRTALDGYRGTPTSGVPIGGMLVQNEVDRFNFESAEGMSTYSVIVDAMLWCTE